MKLGFSDDEVANIVVAPRRGAWIETLSVKSTAGISICRAPQGRVD